MSEVLADFIRALRSADVRISTSESIDAGRALALVGYDDRTTLRAALSQALAKSQDDKEAFGETFERFFAFDQFTRNPPSQDSSEDENDSGDEEKKGESGGMPGPGSGGLSGEREGDGAPQDDLAGLLASGDQAALQMALAEAARQVNLNRIRLFTQRGMYTRRMMEVMGLDALNDRIEGAERDGETVKAERMREARDGLREQVRDYVEKQLELFTKNTGRQLREEVLSQVRLSNVDRSDMRFLRIVVRKMAKRLVALHSRRKTVTRRGMLDVRRTIRANTGFDGLLFHTIWKKSKVDRPRVIAVCDVSGSVAQVSQFLLMFLYSVQEVLPEVRSFAFSGRLGEVTDIFKKSDLEKAMVETLREFGGGSTDYGQAFRDLEALAISGIDHSTTVLILGDARSNNGNPRADILKKIHARAKQVIWLNPEGKSLWNTGDSEMRALSPYCDRTVSCSTIRGLERVVSDLLRSAS
ncbi:MAG: VWA domain-containing protein [Parvibaculaceae bacterium]|nr:VWA domain-containing protein [Parvibaculaceae bacterium]